MNESILLACPKHIVTKTSKFLWIKKTKKVLGKHSIYCSSISFDLTYTITACCEYCNSHWIFALDNEVDFYMWFNELPYIDNYTKKYTHRYSMYYDELKKYLKPKFRKTEDR